MFKNIGTLKFITCGSVDDGKSTLMGRMLFENKSIFNDQLEELKSASLKYTKSQEIDYSMLLDGLSSEREQKITIDVAYRYFQTKKRKFIVADSPGHEQYTRNMVTGASNSDLAIILINAKKGIVEQTVRHSFICSLLRIKNIIIAVNKMDKVNFSNKIFNDIKEKYLKLIQEYEFEKVDIIPISALYGYNIIKKSKKLNWYKGPSLLSILENTKISDSYNKDFLLPIQLVQTNKSNKRRYLGTLRNGKIKIKDKLIILPSFEKPVVKKIFANNKKVTQAIGGEAISIEFDKEVDLSRGDILVKSMNNFMLSDSFTANLIWMDSTPAFIGRLYNIKIGHVTLSAQIVKIYFRNNMQSFSKESTLKLKANDIASVEIQLEKKVPSTIFKVNKMMGSFILIDRVNKNTIGIGMIEQQSSLPKNIFYSSGFISKKLRNISNGHKSKVIWFTGLSGAGKSTLAKVLEKKLFNDGIRTFILDGDNLRTGINKNLGFSENDRIENIRRVSEISKLMIDAGVLVLVCLISPFENERKTAKKLFKKGDFLEVFVKASLKVLEKRDVKGLYKKARLGKIKNFTGISSPYEVPADPDITIDTEAKKIEECVNILYKKIKPLL